MKRIGLIFAAALVWPGVGSAHDSAGRNGGRVTDAGRYHIELVVKAGNVDVFISDANDRPVPAQGFKGTAIFVVEGKSQRIVLEPADGTRLSGTAAVALPVQPKGVVQIADPDGKTAQGRYN